MKQKIGHAQKKLIAAKKEHNALRKSKQKDNATKKQLKRLESMIPSLKREAYQEKMRMLNKSSRESKLEEIEKIEKARLQELIEEDLRRRREQKDLKVILGDCAKDSKQKCNSCGSPLKDVYGVNRCKCN